VSRFILRVVGAAGARGNSPRFQRGSNSPRAFYRPPRRCSARDNGKIKNSKTVPKTAYRELSKASALA